MARHEAPLRAGGSAIHEAAKRWPSLVLGAPRLATGLVVALLCVLLTTAAVAASQPGDVAYGVRVAGERVPALLMRGPESRARAELAIAERRLGDLDRTVNRQELDERAVATLLKSVDDVAGQAAGLSEIQREALAAHLQERAQHLARVGEVAGSTIDRSQRLVLTPRS